MSPSFAINYQGAGTSISFNPFDESKLALTSADNFAIAGKGRTLIVQVTFSSKIDFRCFLPMNAE